MTLEKLVDRLGMGQHQQMAGAGEEDVGPGESVRQDVVAVAVDVEHGD